MNRPRVSSPLRLIVFAPLLMIVAAAGQTPGNQTETKSAAPPAITAEQILDRAAMVVNSSRAKLETLHIEGSMAIETNPLMEEYRIYYKQPDNELDMIETQGHGTVKYGRDHGKVWFDYYHGEIWPPVIAINAVSVDMLGYALRAWYEPNWRDHFDRAQLIGRTTDGHKQCILIRLTSKSLKDPEDRCFDINTLLLARLDRVQRFKKAKDAPDTAFVVTFRYSDYAENNGFKVPRKLESQAVGLHLDFENRRIELNAPIDDAIFTDTRKHR